MNKGRREVRTLYSFPINGEEIGFPLAAQAAVLRRKVTGHAEEIIIVLTSRPAKELDAAAWLKIIRSHWGIENGLHQRLDVSHDDDRSRVCNQNAMLVRSMFIRFSNSLLAEWKNNFPKPEQKHTSHFFKFMSSEHCRRAILTVTSRQPSLKSSS